LKFYSLKKTTLIDYPGRVASIIFTKGCNLRCPFCHNRELVDDGFAIEPIEWGEIFEHLTKRKNVLGGVCISGGEPLLYCDDLKKVIDDIHSLGLRVKIDTNGILCESLKTLDVDYIAMDIKTSIEKYDVLGYKGTDDYKENILKTIDYIITSGVDHEFRTTVVPGIVDIEDIEKICQLIVNSKRYVLSQFRPFNSLDPEFERIKPYPFKILEEMKNIALSLGINCSIRGE
jgi:pyruvate formate lyase activating enzyme